MAHILDTWQAVIMQDLPRGGWYTRWNITQMLFDPVLKKSLLDRYLIDTQPQLKAAELNIGSGWAQRCLHTSKVQQLLAHLYASYPCLLCFSQLQLAHQLEALKVVWVRPGHRIQPVYSEFSGEHVLVDQHQHWLQLPAASTSHQMNQIINPASTISQYINCAHCVREHQGQQQLAVLLQTQRGSGWYTLHENQQLLLEPSIVCWLEPDANSTTPDVHQLCTWLKLTFTEFQHLDHTELTQLLHTLSVQWIPVGTAFSVNSIADTEFVLTWNSADWITVAADDETAYSMQESTT